MSSPAPVLLAGAWRQASGPVGFFQATNPATGSKFETKYPVSSYPDLERALDAARAAAEELRFVPFEQTAQFLERFADNLQDAAEELVHMAHLETALSVEPRLRTVELPRTVDQLRQAANATRERSWALATIDSRANIRSWYAPLAAPVVIFGPNNFPFAFNAVAGGDFAAAIAAGNPVIAKAHPNHPGTTRLLATAAFDAVKETGQPLSLVQLFYHTEPENGLRMVGHPNVGAVAFTGSRKSGLVLKEAADRAGKPIYLELSSINPVFVLPGALAQRMKDIAAQFNASCTLGAGQFCTNPGLVVLQASGLGERFLRLVQERLENIPAGTLLTERGPTELADKVQMLRAHGAQLVMGGEPLAGPAFRFANTLLRVSGDTFLEQARALQTEMFGTISLFVFARNSGQMAEIAAEMEGNLTGCIYSDSEGSDDGLYTEIEPVLRQKVGRLLNDKMPTGVAVSPAMVHGGPYPATGHPGFTAVGMPASIRRFAALHGYDNVRHDRLPPALQDQNPTGRMWRFVDGEWKQGDV